jgi:hypothetical protein
LPEKADQPLLQSIIFSVPIADIWRTSQTTAAEPSQSSSLGDGSCPFTFRTLPFASAVAFSRGYNDGVGGTFRCAAADRRKGGEPRALRDLPDGRGRGAAADVGRHSITHRPVACAAGAHMTGARPNAPDNQGERYASVQANRARFSVAVPPTASFDRLLPAARAICLAQAGQRRDPRPKPPGIWRMSVNKSPSRPLPAQRTVNR